MGKETIYMKCKLLIVSKGKSFLIDSVIADLDQSRITTVCCEYDVKSIVHRAVFGYHKGACVY